MGVTKLELTAKPYKDGVAFAAAGAYEELTGIAYFALGPLHRLNRGITDLKLAPAAADGRVHFGADLVILRPVQTSRGNRRLIFDAVNRGNPILRSLGPEEWVLDQGYTVVRCGWQHDVPRERIGIDRVEPLVDGKPISGRMSHVFEPDGPAHVFALGEDGHIPYRVSEADQASAVLTEYDYLLGPARVIPREDWCFGRIEGEAVVTDLSSVYYERGFTPGKAYEVVFTALGAPLTGHGFAATRDIVSFLRHASAGEGNPCAGSLDFALAFGASQSGRYLRQFIYGGFCEDEQGRLVFDGLLPHTGGARLLESNWRFGQPAYNGWDSMSALFPFTDAVQTDAVTGQRDGLQRRNIEAGLRPKVIYTNSSAEYWGGQVGSLSHVAADSCSDAQMPQNVRSYHFSGTQHGVMPLKSPPGGRAARGAYPMNTINYVPLLRAAFRSLDDWATRGVEPPASRYGRLADGSLQTREALRPALAHLPGPGLPQVLANFSRLDFGDGAAESGIAVNVPARIGAPLALHASAVDADGNEVAGVRHPEVAVPLATYTGWNPRHPDIGGGEQNLRTAGASIRFARTKAEREASGDPRPSIAERYGSRQAYQAAIRTEAEALARGRYLLREDIDEVVDYAGQRYDLYMSQEP